MHKKLNSKHLNIIALYNILLLMFSTNVFTYKNSYHKQIKGLGMGWIAGPSVANIYVYILERNWLYIHRASIYIYKIFIDDIYDSKIKIKLRKIWKKLSVS